MNPCQTAQHITDHSSPAGSAPTVCGSLASAAPGVPAEGLAVRAVHSGTLYQAEQSSSRGAAGDAEPLMATAASLFGLSPDS